MNEDMVEAVFDWISEMRAGNLRFIIEVPNISLPHLEAWSHIKAWSEKNHFGNRSPGFHSRKYGIQYGIQFACKTCKFAHAFTTYLVLLVESLER